MVDELLSLKDKFLNREVLVVSAGPSAVRWRSIYDSIKDRDPIVVCVKQAIEIDELDEICEIHFINPYNLKRYKYKKKPMVVFSDAVDAPDVWNSYDVRMIVKKKTNASLKDTLAYRMNFDDYLIDVSGIHRPWGPGIMYESVFYTLLYLGFRKIITIGWDIADSSGVNMHYYDTNVSSDYVSGFVMKIFVRLKMTPVYNFFRFISGKKYNKAGMYKGEAELIASSVDSLKKWLISRNVELEVISDSKWLN